MAPEDVLKSVDESRREFLKKVIGGTAFAVPLLHSFSMGGLSIDPANANNFQLCSNATSTPCCELAEVISVFIGCVISVTGCILLKEGASPIVKARLFKPLAKALECMSIGVDGGGGGAGDHFEDDDDDQNDAGGDCQSSDAKSQFNKARSFLVSYLSLLQELCGTNNPVVSVLPPFLADLDLAFDALLSGDCANGLIVTGRLGPAVKQARLQFRASGR